MRGSKMKQLYQLDVSEWTKIMLLYSQTHLICTLLIHHFHLIHRYPLEPLFTN